MDYACTDVCVCVCAHGMRICVRACVHAAKRVSVPLIQPCITMLEHVRGSPAVLLCVHTVVADALELHHKEKEAALCPFLNVAVIVFAQLQEKGPRSMNVHEPKQILLFLDFFITQCAFEYASLCLCFSVSGSGGGCGCIMWP